MTRRALLLGAAALLAAVLAVVGPIGRAHACSCMELRPGQALENADVAFVGVVAGVHDPSAANPMVSSGDPVIYAFVVEEVMKQAVAIPGAVDVTSARDGASCGQTFAIGQRWRLYAYSDGAAGLSTGICSGNELLAEQVPIPAGPDDPPSGPPVQLLLVLGAVGVVVGVSAWAFTRRGRSPSA